MVQMNNDTQNKTLTDTEGIGYVLYKTKNRGVKRVHGKNKRNYR